MALVEEARARVSEITPDELARRTRAGEKIFLVDTREDREWQQSRIPRAMHLGKGVIERDIERAIPDKSAEIVCYCGGGYRSVLACDNLQKMGYANTRSLAGGIRGWIAEGRPLDMRSRQD